MSRLDCAALAAVVRAAKPRRRPLPFHVHPADPTVNRLEATAASVFMKDAALFVPSGTMGNLCAVLALAGGRVGPLEAILGDESHILHYEVGGLSAVAGLSSRAVPTQADGSLALDNISAAVREDDVHYPRTAMVCLENSHNRRGGRVLSAEYCDDVGALCKERGLALHIDGARIFNAAARLGVPPARLAAAADTVSVCLSKGLGAPVGSVLVGSHGLIAAARRFRKMLGGGMRQAGVIAAPGLLALTENSAPEQLARDHRLAASLALALAAVPGLSIEHKVETNIVYASVGSAFQGSSSELCEKLKSGGVLAGAYGTEQVRFVVHRQVPDDAVERVTGALAT